MRRRIDGGYWPLGASTRGAHRLAPGDRVIFYLAGEGNRMFVGEAEVASAPQPLREIAPESAHGLEPEMPRGVGLREIRMWPNRVDVGALAPRLRFLRATIESRSGQRNPWAARFAVGLVSIREDDFDTILAAASRRR
jgi:hypothetical protein